MKLTMTSKIAKLKEKIFTDIEEIKTCAEFYGTEGINLSQVSSLEKSLIELRKLEINQKLEARFLLMELMEVK